MTAQEKFGFFAIGLAIVGVIVMFWSSTVGFVIWSFGLGLSHGLAVSEFGDKHEPR